MTMTTDSVLNIFTFSDPHFAHPRTDAANGLRAIRRYFPDAPETAKYDICFMAGDWTDHGIGLADPSVYYIQAAAIHLLKVCAKYKIKLRLLRGTTSHERNQTMLFVWLNETLEIGCDLKYVTTLSIEYIDDLDLNVLYVPDEWNHEAETTLEQVKELMRTRGLTKVDMAITHGAWLHQLQGFQSPAYHDAVRWSELVEMLILSGHVHTFSRYLKHVSIGSTERTTHGEEEAKGFLEFTFTNKKETHFRFIENKLAKKFLTLNIMGMRISDIITLIGQHRELPNGSAIRLEYNSDDAIKAIREELQAQFPQYIFTDIRRGNKETKTEGQLQSLLLKTKTSRHPIGPDNLMSLLRTHLEEQKVDSQKLDRILTLVKGVA